jgi:GNAT superfamily N-acetyltransferase
MTMRPVAHAIQIRTALDRVKSAGAPFQTNFFQSGEALSKAASEDRLFLYETPAVALMVWREPAFDRIYYACGGSPDALTAALRAMALPASGNLISDVVGSPDATGEHVARFEQAGFQIYTTFQRMQRLPKGPPPAEDADPLVVPATPADAPAVLDAIAAHFDQYAEHIPGLPEIEQAAARGVVLLAKAGARIAAVLYYDRIGVTTTLRYWLALPGFRGQGHADRLMRAYFQACADSKRFLLWVEKSNKRAQGLYLHYGYTAAPTIDVILRKSGVSTPAPMTPLSAQEPETHG